MVRPTTDSARPISPSPRSRRARTVSILGVAALALSMAAVGCGSSDSSEGADVSTEPVDANSSETSTTADEATEDSGGSEETATTEPAPVDETDSGGSGTSGEPELIFTPSTSSSLAVGQSWFLGGWDGSGWVNADGSSPAALGASVGDVYTMIDGPTATGLTVTATDVAAVCEPIAYEFVDTDPELHLEAMGISAPWNLQPRLPETTDDPGAAYVAAAADFLADQGYAGSQTAGITQWFRVDLEGDGTDEVVMVIESGAFREFGYGDNGDFSGVLLRKVVVNAAGEESVQTSSLGFSQVETSENDEFGYIEFFDVIGFADLNGDTRLEILIGSQYYEGASSMVWEYTDTSVGPELVLGSGCGA